MSITKKYLINGPINAIRLEKDDKVIYLLSDFHIDVKYQTECEYSKKYDSLNIDQFLVNFMKSIKDQYDLIVEIGLDELNYTKADFIDKYFIDIKKLFGKNINFSDNKIVKSKKYPDIRFHYFDFRNMFDAHNVFYNDFNLLPPFYLLLDYIDSVINFLNNTKENIIKFNENINKNNPNKFINKLYNKNPNNKINEIIEELFKKDFFNKSKNQIEELLEYLYESYDIITNKYISSEMKLEITSKVDKELSIIIESLLQYFHLPDVYIIKRIIDKSYMKKSIIYSGHNHQTLILYLLVKYFNFNITHVYYMDNTLKNPQDLQNKILSNKININELPELLVNYNEYNEPIQCINLFNFPDNFS